MTTILKCLFLLCLITLFTRENFHNSETWITSVVTMRFFPRQQAMNANRVYKRKRAVINFKSISVAKIVLK